MDFQRSDTAVRFARQENLRALDVIVLFDGRPEGVVLPVDVFNRTGLIEYPGKAITTPSP